MNDAQIKHMGEQFLRWQLPENFNPDGGISFEPIGNKGNSTYEFKRRPSGTNLLDYTQAEAMVRHMLDGLPAKAETTMTSNLDPAYRSPKEDAAYYGSIWSLSTNQMAMLEKSFAEHERTLSHAGEGEPRAAFIEGYICASGHRDSAGEEAQLEREAAEMWEYSAAAAQAALARKGEGTAE